MAITQTQPGQFPDANNGAPFVGRTNEWGQPAPDRAPQPNRRKKSGLILGSLVATGTLFVGGIAFVAGRGSVEAESVTAGPAPTTLDATPETSVLGAEEGNLAPPESTPETSVASVEEIDPATRLIEIGYPTEITELRYFEPDETFSLIMNNLAAAYNTDSEATFWAALGYESELDAPENVAEQALANFSKPRSNFIKYEVMDPENITYSRDGNIVTYEGKFRAYFFDKDATEVSTVSVDNNFMASKDIIGRIFIDTTTGEITNYPLLDDYNYGA